jgi:hypothetical protein
MYDNFNLHEVETPLRRLCRTTIGLVWNLQIIFHPFIIHIIRNNHQTIEKCPAVLQQIKITKLLMLKDIYRFRIYCHIFVISNI